MLHAAIHTTVLAAPVPSFHSVGSGWCDAPPLVSEEARGRARCLARCEDACLYVVGDADRSWCATFDACDAFVEDFAVALETYRREGRPTNS